MLATSVSVRGDPSMHARWMAVTVASHVGTGTATTMVDDLDVVCGCLPAREGPGAGMGGACAVTASDPSALARARSAST